MCLSFSRMVVSARGPRKGSGARRDPARAAGTVRAAACRCGSGTRAGRAAPCRATPWICCRALVTASRRRSALLTRRSAPSPALALVEGLAGDGVGKRRHRAPAIDLGLGALGLQLVQDPRQLGRPDVRPAPACRPGSAAVAALRKPQTRSRHRHHRDRRAAPRRLRDASPEPPRLHRHLVRNLRSHRSHCRPLGGPSTNTSFPDACFSPLAGAISVPAGSVSAWALRLTLASRLIAARAASNANRRAAAGRGANAIVRRP